MLQTSRKIPSICVFLSGRDTGFASSFSTSFTYIFRQKSTGVRRDDIMSYNARCYRLQGSLQKDLIWQWQILRASFAVRAYKFLPFR